MSFNSSKPSAVSVVAAIASALGVKVEGLTEDAPALTSKSGQYIVVGENPGGVYIPTVRFNNGGNAVPDKSFGFNSYDEAEKFREYKQRTRNKVYRVFSLVGGFAEAPKKALDKDKVAEALGTLSALLKQ